MKKWIVMLVAALCALAGPVGAAVISNTVHVSGALRTDGTGFDFTAEVSPFAVRAGDLIDTIVVFDQPLLIEDLNGVLETIQASYRHTGSDASGLSTISETKVFYAMLLDYTGSTSGDWDDGWVEGGGNGMSAAFSTADWTDSAFTLRGLEIITQVLDFQLVRGDGMFGSVYGSIVADRITITATQTALPEPATWALALLPLALLARRRLT